MPVIPSTQSDYLETLRRIAAGMGPRQGFQASLRSFLGLLSERHGFLRPHLVIFDPETRTLRLCVAEGAPRREQVVYQPGIGVTGRVFASGHPVIVDCIKDDPDFLSKFFARTEEELGELSFISVPILTPDKGLAIEREPRTVLGVLSVDTPKMEHAALALHCQFLEVVAGLIATHTVYLQEEMATQRRHTASRIRPVAVENEVQELIAVSEPMRIVVEQALCAARGRNPVLLTGEVSTGKGRIAIFIHEESERRELPLVRFQLPQREQPLGDQEVPLDTLLARELFGYRKGAFPGATQTRKGLFELAQCSTLFLEDIDRLSLPLQERLLHVLQDQTVLREGGGDPVRIDMRLVCSTTRDLSALVAEGRFMDELYRRISSISLHLLPLRERVEDIVPLAEHFLQQASKAAGRAIRRLSGPASERLSRFGWSGNIRELIRCIESAVSVCEESVLRLSHLPASLQSTPEEVASSLSFNDAVARFEQELLVAALQRSQGNMLQAARDLRVSYRIVHYKIKKYGLDPRLFA